LLHAWIKLQLLDPSDQFDIRQLFSRVQQLQAAKPELALLKPLWLTISAAAAASTNGTQATLKGLVKAWRAQADDDSAEFSAELIGLGALQDHKKGHLAQVGPCVSTRQGRPVIGSHCLRILLVYRMALWPFLCGVKNTFITLKTGKPNVSYPQAFL